MAELTLSTRGGRTRLTRCRTCPPLVVQRALYPDDALPDMAFVYLANPTGGLFQGDRIAVSVRLSPGARAHVTTQSATKVYSMPQGCAQQEVSLSVAAGGFLEYLPDPIIPFRDAHLVQKTSIAVEPGGTLLHWEIISPGRVAMGESFAYRRLDYRLTAQDSQGRPVYHEAYSLAPGNRNPMDFAVLGRDAGAVQGAPLPKALGSMLVLTSDSGAAALLDELTEAVRLWSNVQAGVSRLPSEEGLGIKVVGPDTASVQAALNLCWSSSRRHLLRKEVSFPRKY